MIMLHITETISMVAKEESGICPGIHTLRTIHSIINCKMYFVNLCTKLILLVINSITMNSNIFFTYFFYKKIYHPVSFFYILVMYNKNMKEVKEYVQNLNWKIINSELRKIIQSLVNKESIEYRDFRELLSTGFLQVKADIIIIIENKFKKYKGHEKLRIALNMFSTFARHYLKPAAEKIMTKLHVSYKMKNDIIEVIDDCKFSLPMDDIASSISQLVQLSNEIGKRRLWTRFKSMFRKNSCLPVFSN